MTLRVLFANETLIAIDKPSGMLVHRTALAPKEGLAALQALRDQMGHRIFPLHRLDRPTSGVLLFAKDSDTARLMGGLFQSGLVRKEYWAVLRGWLPPSGTIEHALHPLKRGKGKDRDRPTQEATTHFRVLDQVACPFAGSRHATSRFSLVAVQPVTGRQHQIRRHFKHCCHPLIGDTVYGDGVQNRLCREHLGVHRLMLHAATLSFIHPVTHQGVHLSAPPDPTLKKLLDAFGFSLPEPPTDPGQAKPETAMD
jgi:tRNA pseudouridine65 synthase